MPVRLVLFVFGLVYCWVRARSLIKNIDLSKDYPEEVRAKLESLYTKIAKLELFCLGFNSI